MAYFWPIFFCISLNCNFTYTFILLWVKECEKGQDIAQKSVSHHRISIAKKGYFYPFHFFRLVASLNIKNCPILSTTWMIVFSFVSCFSHIHVIFIACSGLFLYCISISRHVLIICSKKHFIRSSPHPIFKYKFQIT